MEAPHIKKDKPEMYQSDPAMTFASVLFMVAVAIVLWQAAIRLVRSYNYAKPRANEPDVKDVDWMPMNRPPSRGWLRRTKPMAFDESPVTCEPEPAGEKRLEER